MEQTQPEAPDAVATLYGEDSVTLKNGDKILIRKVSLRTVGPVLEYVQSIFADFKIEGGMPTIDLLNPSLILQLISKHLDPTYKMAVLMSSVTLDALLDADLDDSLKIIMKIIEVNRAFFIEKIMPMLPGLAPLLAQLSAKGE